MKTSVTEHGTMFVTRYQMDAGEAVKEHTHPVEHGHITICAKGRARIAGPKFEIVLNAGDMIDYTDEQQTHGITALDDDTVVFNVLKAP